MEPKSQTIRRKIIGPYEQMIAGHARAKGLVLVTNNLRAFERIPGLRIEDGVSD